MRPPCQPTVATTSDISNGAVPHTVHHINQSKSNILQKEILAENRQAINSTSISTAKQTISNCCESEQFVRDSVTKQQSATQSFEHFSENDTNRSVELCDDNRRFSGHSVTYGINGDSVSDQYQSTVPVDGNQIVENKSRNSLSETNKGQSPNASTGDKSTGSIASGGKLCSDFVKCDFRKVNTLSESPTHQLDVDNSDIDDSDSENAPLLVHDPQRTITLVKNNSASLIFTRKEFNPVVHRTRSVSLSQSDSNVGSTKTKHRHSLHLPGDIIQRHQHGASHLERRKQVRSWYASIYSTLDEEIEQDLKVNIFWVD